MAFFSLITKLNIVYTIGAVYTGATAAIAWFASSSLNKVIVDNCNTWVKPVNNETQTITEFLQESSKQEICKWAPFLADLVVVGGTFQLFGMGLYGVDFRVTNIEKVKYGLGGISSCLMQIFIEQDTPNSEIDLSGDLRDLPGNSPV